MQLPRLKIDKPEHIWYYFAYSESSDWVEMEHINLETHWRTELVFKRYLLGSKYYSSVTRLLNVLGLFLCLFFQKAGKSIGSAEWDTILFLSLAANWLSANGRIKWHKSYFLHHFSCCPHKFHIHFFLPSPQSKSFSVFSHSFFPSLAFSITLSHYFLAIALWLY